MQSARLKSRAVEQRQTDQAVTLTKIQRLIKMDMERDTERDRDGYAKRYREGLLIS